MMRETRQDPTEPDGFTLARHAQAEYAAAVRFTQRHTRRGPFWRDGGSVLAGRVARGAKR